MKAPRSFVGTLTSWEWLATFRMRALIFGGLIAICAILTFFPERYKAQATLTPTDPSSLGLSGTLGQLGALNSVFGNQAAIEVALRIGDSQEVQNRVIKETHLDQRLNKSLIRTHRWLHDRVDLRSLRGGIIQIDLVSLDQQLAFDVISSYASAIRDRLADIGRDQTAYKRRILGQLVTKTSEDLAAAQSRYDTFRLSHQDAVPDLQTAVVAQRVDNLEAAYRAKQVTVDVMRTIYTEDNFTLKQMREQMAALKAQLAEARGTNPQDHLSVGNVVGSTAVLFKLQRELALERSLYDNYARFLQGTAVEDLTSTANVRILEPPHIETEQQYWLPALGTGILLVLLWAAVEFYRLRPPLGANVPRARAAEAPVYTEGPY